MPTLEHLLIPIPLPNRDPILPKHYWSYGHPLVPEGEKAIVMEVDTSPAAMRKIYEWEKKQKVPIATEEVLLARDGVIRVPEDTLVFSRATGSTDARNDALQAWLTPAHLIAHTDKANLLAATKAAMGPSELITLNPPVRDATGEWIGGLAIERGDGRCNPVKPDTRCYTIANSYQSQKGTWAPAQASKVNGSFDENNLMRRNLNIATAPFPMAAMKQIPNDVRQTIDDYTSMLNIPALGLPGNTAHNTLQLNIAPAVPYGSKASLGDSLGFYGKLHNDNKDSPARFTNMTMCSNLPDNYTLSQFHIVRFGIYFVLHNFDSANFCGLNYHGGTPAIAPEGVEVAPDAYRMTFISYPPEKMGDGLGHVVVGAMPASNDGVLKMSAEMQHVDCESRDTRAFTNKANFAADGPVVMAIRAHVIFMARMFLLLIIFLSNQLPRFYDFRIDSDRFLSSFSFAVDGTRESVGPWRKGPGYRMPDGASDVNMDAEAPEASDGGTLIAQESIRSRIKCRWRLHYNHYASHIPYAVLHEKRFEVDETGALLEEAVVGTEAVDMLGNPIETGGRPYVKPAPPISKSKLEKLARAALRKAEKAAEGDPDSDADGPRRSKRKRAKAAADTEDSEHTSSSIDSFQRRSKRIQKGKARAESESSPSDDSQQPSHVLRGSKGKHASKAKSALWNSAAYMQMETEGLFMKLNSISGCQWLRR
ncbi:hypothetical protein B0H13DRAFT_2306049 [Mycena leptocephala]|nr:hypothetical protein B0H13DRAFT_2306049 [Mycena leptocephala]